MKVIRSVLQSKIAIFVLCMLGVLVRLYGFDNPIADWHSWRQADTSSVSRYYVENGITLLIPRYHDLSNVPSTLDNPEGYRFVEFPIYNALQAGLFMLVGVFTLEQWGRLVSILASIGSGLIIYLLVKKYVDGVAAFFALFFYLFLPFNIYYSRTILPDTSMVFATLAAILFFDKWASDPSRVFQGRAVGYYLLALCFAAIAILLKPFAAFFLLPIVYLSWRAFGISIFKRWELYLFAVVSVLPFIAWRMWMMQFPEGIPANAWLFNANDIRFKGSFFYWLFADRIGRLILGIWGVGLLVLGVAVYSAPSQIKKHSVLFYFFALSSILYLVIIAGGNVQHDYYQIPIIPSLVIFLGIGAKFLLHPPVEFVNKYVSAGLLLICSVFLLMFGWYYIRDYFNINNPLLVEAGKVVDEKTPEDAKVIALYDGDTTFLYQTKRRGWASYQNDLPVMIEKGAEYLVMVSPPERDVLALSQQYEVIASTSSYLLVRLK